MIDFFELKQMSNDKLLKLLISIYHRGRMDECEGKINSHKALNEVYDKIK